MAKACVLLADGFEEIEAITVIDVLRRVGVEVTAVGVRGLDVRGGHGVKLHADGLLRDLQQVPWDAVIVPGGSKGATTLRDDPDTQVFLRAQALRQSVLLAAICAGPIALAPAGLLEGRTVTCYPGFEGELAGARVSHEAVVTDGRLITSRGVGTAMTFALALAERLTGKAEMDEHRRKMLVTPV
ncbi:MAG TPA: DJ-1 family glyoxalase III [Myxococcota bacterium]|nr:DJ-1 family glyoxalase III [Myxococcota bacterium]